MTDFVDIFVYFWWNSLRRRLDFNRIQSAWSIDARSIKKTRSAGKSSRRQSWKKRHYNVRSVTLSICCWVPGCLTSCVAYRLSKLPITTPSVGLLSPGWGGITAAVEWNVRSGSNIHLQGRRVAFSGHVHQENGYLDIPSPTAVPFPDIACKSALFSIHTTQVKRCMSSGQLIDSTNSRCYRFSAYIGFLF